MNNMDKKRKPKMINFNLQKETDEQKILKFFANRLIQVANDPQVIWEITKNDNNPIKLDEQELKQVLELLKEKLKNQELSPQIYDQIIAAIERNP
uniref:Uncharacterized protein n=2 Tax=Gloeothece TaxID=28070 RepID=E0UNN8_GLOV7|nr:conserved hypothetical protein [Gloeothece verrucosa PCC 7822]